MKKFLLCITTIFFLLRAEGQVNTIPIYYSPVTMPVSLKNNYYSFFDTKLLAEDLAGLLQQATGVSFTPEVYSQQTGKGIFLLLDSTTRTIGNETGIFETDGKKFIRITSGYTTGISYAMYSWLEELGFHFYLPGKEWADIPSLRSVFGDKPIKKNYKPWFKVRMLNVSGGSPTIKGLDETWQNLKEWQQWFVRNRMGCEYNEIGGHVGEAFNITHRKEIENDSLILAPVNGKRQYAVTGKLDPTYKKGVDMFGNWIVDQFIKGKSVYPDFLPFKKYQSADAGDGLGYCHTPACEKEFKTVSDQSFSIINETAKKIMLADPHAGVSTLAYSERADTPNIHIEPNVHVMIVASAFQSVSTAAELVKRWAKKSDHISVYGYLNIGIWTSDNPYFNLYRYINYLQFLQSLNVEGLCFETSLSKFGSGIMQYFILKFLRDPYVSVDNVLNEFCSSNFGKAAVPIKKLLKEWYFSDVHMNTNYDYPTFYEDELGRFVQYIVDAETTPGITAATKTRIEELKAYTIYLCKYYELFAELKSTQEYKKDPSLRIQKLEELLTYTWQLYFTKIFQNTQLNDVLKRPLTAEQKEKWNYSQSDLFKNITANAGPVVKNEFEKTLKKYLPLAVPNYPITDSFFTANTKYSADSIRINTTDEAAISNFIYPVQFYCAVPGILTIRYEAGVSLLKNKPGKVAIVSVESSDYKYIKTNIVYDEKSEGTFSYSIPAKGHYKLYLSQFNGTHISYVIYPGNNLFYHNKKSILPNELTMQDGGEENFYPNKYLAIYAPLSDSIFFTNRFVDSRNTSRFYTSSGIPITVKENKELLYNVAIVPKESQKHFIFYENSQFRWPPVLKNTAPYYFFLRYPLK